MKKITAIAAISVAALLPAAAFAAIAPTDLTPSNISSAVWTFANGSVAAIFDPSGNSMIFYDDHNDPGCTLSTCGGGGAVAAIQAVGAGTFTVIDSGGHAWSGCSTVADCEATLYSPVVSHITYTPPAPPPAAPSGGGALFALPTSTATSWTANVGAQLGNLGTISLIGLISGVYLVFWLMKELIELVPKRRK